MLLFCAVSIPTQYTLRNSEIYLIKIIIISKIKQGSRSGLDIISKDNKDSQSWKSVERPLKEIKYKQTMFILISLSWVPADFSVAKQSNKV